MRIGIITALEAEARTLPARAGSLGGRHEFIVLVAGPGQARAARAAAALIDRHCHALLSWGLAGGLAPSLVPGALIVASTVRTDTGVAFDCDAALAQELLAPLADLGAITAALYSCADPIVDARAKAALHATHVAAADMESAAIAGAALHAKLPFAAVRCVVDPAHFNLPAAALVGLTPAGRTRLAATLASIARQPQQTAALLRLALWYRRALGTLRHASAMLCR